MHATPRPRRALFLAGAATTALILTGCSGGAEEAEGPVTLTFAASTFGDPGLGPRLQAFVDEFNASQDGVIIEPASVPFPTFGQTVLTQMGGGEGPDLVRFDMPEFSTAAAAGLLEPLDDVIDAAELGLQPGPDEYLFVDDARYGVIHDTSNYVMFYNADLVPEPPTTFDEFLATAQATTQGDVYGLAFRQTQAEENGVWQDIFNYVYGFGGQWSDGENLTLDDPKNIEGLEAFQTMYDADVIPKGADAATFRRMFAQNLVGMELNNGGYVVATKGTNPDLNFSVAPIPFPVRAQGAIMAPIVVNANSEYKEAAYTYIEWMLQPEQQQKLQEALGAASMATPTERSAESLEEMPFLTVFDELTNTSAPQIVVGFGPQTPEIRSIVVREVIAALQGQQTMQEAMERAQAEAEGIVGAP
ncbi:sugar ABC transporter substrate-binding protein [Microbacterium sp. zg-Y818]|uniref:ABC transporter substrate-binding protein n=1 Tax=unclassified Microbacterium TaxID=2609290 RepID=UPI00214C7985|nr:MULTISPECIES: sugar ABC transporter substrate-binding protein [unclassified Microbacterium]MCR2800299.1 sugar ABC transporter substrate-binding protein [Microbacterium sp. zg.Y818]WIM22261.1 sugar ABC transporter substrate-binding protein [Microbacterium sp. zg-Y818]